MSWLALVAFLELAYLPMGDCVMYEAPNVVYARGGLAVTMDAEVVAFDHVFIGGNIMTAMWADDPDYSEGQLGFWPERMGYQFRAGVRFDPVEIGFRHYCTHPVVPWMPWMPQQIVWEGGYEEVYLRIGTPRR